MTIATKYKKASEVLHQYSRLLQDNGWSPAMSASCSVRLTGQHCVITGMTGSPAASQAVVTDWDGASVTPGIPSNDVLLHTQLYYRDPNIGAVMHVHNRSASLISRIWKDDILLLEGWGLNSVFEQSAEATQMLSIPIFENGPETSRLAGRIETRMRRCGQSVAYLLRGNGMVVWGRDIDECQRYVDALDVLLDYELTLALKLRA